LPLVEPDALDPPGGSDVSQQHIQLSVGGKRRRRRTDGSADTGMAK
jgi:hypothetical protein